MIATWALPDVFAEAPEGATSMLHDYFETYTGRHFERLCGGGDAPGTADVITPADLVAVSMLSVSFAGDAAFAVLDTYAAALTELLAQIPTDITLLAAGDEHIGRESPAWRMWNLLRSPDIPGVGRTKASKLMARKRPHLIPVQDADVCAELGHPRKANFWATLRHYLREHECGGGVTFADWLRQARAASGIGEDISDIRVFDVLVWMHHHAEDHDAGPAER